MFNEKDSRSTQSVRRHLVSVADDARRLMYERALAALRSSEATRNGQLESVREFVCSLAGERER